MKILLRLFSLKLLTAVLGLLYSILQVHYFGASRTIEIYFAAQSLVYLVSSLTQSGQLAEVFLPIFHKLNVIKKGYGYLGLNVVLTRMFLFGMFLLSIVFLFAPSLVDLMVPGFTSADKEMTSLIFRMFIPVLFLVLMNSFFVTVLNAEERFGRAEFLSLTNTLVNILVLVILYPYIQLWALVLSFVLGRFIEFVFYAWQLYKNGFRFKWVWSLPEFDHISFFKTMRSTLIYVGATQIYNIVLTASISFLPEGVYAIFKYVQNLASKIKGLFIQPFTTIFFTKYSILVQNVKSVSKVFTKNFMSLVNINGVIIIGSILMGDEIIRLIWENKKFVAKDVDLAYVFLLFNCVGILISSLGGLYRKMVVSQGKAKRLYNFWSISQLLTALCTYVFIKYFNVNGLLFIIPLNAFFMAAVSYLIYLRMDYPVKINFFNKNMFYVLFLILVAIGVKFLIFPRFVPNIISVAIGTVFVLSLYPIMTTYKIYSAKE
ncbi:hypothetical protein MWU59_12205 [Flavobacteriaceae bacterium F08102]|nr:hypothetical protein [Flavobacteriaceae bacterium F08102]